MVLAKVRLSTKGQWQRQMEAPAGSERTGMMGNGEQWERPAVMSPVISMPEMQSIQCSCLNRKWRITRVNWFTRPGTVGNWDPKTEINKFKSFESFPRVTRANHSGWSGLVDGLGISWWPSEIPNLGCKHIPSNSKGQGTWLVRVGCHGYFRNSRVQVGLSIPDWLHWQRWRIIHASVWVSHIWYATICPWRFPDNIHISSYWTSLDLARKKKNKYSERQAVIDIDGEAVVLSTGEIILCEWVDSNIFFINTSIKIRWRWWYKWCKGD